MTDPSVEDTDIDTDVDARDIEDAVAVLESAGIRPPLDRAVDTGGGLSTLACRRVFDRLVEDGHVIDAERLRWSTSRDRYDLAREFAREHLGTADIRRLD